jgi:hypothetical protein
VDIQKINWKGMKLKSSISIDTKVRFPDTVLYWQYFEELDKIKSKPRY